VVHLQCQSVPVPPPGYYAFADDLLRSPESPATASIHHERGRFWLIRGVHHWGASLMVLIVFFHMLRTYFFGAYKYPRELTWVTGVVLLLLTLGMGFTGYLLPWNQRAYWATTVATSIASTVPFIGDFINQVLRGGTDLSGVTLARFFSVHIWWFPAMIAGLIGIHLYMVIRLGISAVPKEDD
jgi:quinol-cytochrome oxidoreductase complex cytochrome b subunit